MSNSDDYLIVGAGPAGLVAARALKKAGITFEVIERNSRVGGLWDIENRGTPLYDSAHFISSKYRSAFYGFPMPENYPDYPTHRQIHSYITAFSEWYGLTDSITFGRTVETAHPTSDGKWQVVLDGGEERLYAGVVVASGVNWSPVVPTYRDQDVFTGEMRHVVTYHSSDELADKRVLVVGAGNSGVDIACDAAQRSSAAFLSLRRGYRFVPKHIAGLPTDVFLRGLPETGELRRQLPAGVVLPEDNSELFDFLVGDLTRFGLQAPDHAAYETHPILNSQFIHHLTHGDVSAKPDIERFTANGVYFKDGTFEEIDTVLFATGYDWSVGFLDESLLDRSAGRPDLYLNIFHRKLDGLYFLGFIEFADAAYQRFDEMAQLIVGDITDRLAGNDRREFLQLKAEDRPNLRGEMSYIDSPRHASYVHTNTYQRVIKNTADTRNWPWPSTEYYTAVSDVIDPEFVS